MRIPITVPESLRDEPLRLGEWSLEVGDDVAAGECLAELICPGLAVELSAPTAGVIAELTRQPEERILPGDVIGWIEANEPGVADTGL